MMLMTGGLLAALLLSYSTRPPERREPPMTADASPAPFALPAPPPRIALPPEALARCRGRIAAATRDGVIRKRPSPNRIDVDEQRWRALRPTGRSRLMQAVACDAWHAATPPHSERAVAYDWSSGRRLSILSGIRS